MDGWGIKNLTGNLDIKSLSQKLNETARKIKDDVEKTVDEALGIEQKPKGEGEEEGINYWQEDKEGLGDDDVGGWDIEEDIAKDQEEENVTKAEAKDSDSPPIATPSPSKPEEPEGEPEGEQRESEAEKEADDAPSEDLPRPSEEEEEQSGLERQEGEREGETEKKEDATAAPIDPTPTPTVEEEEPQVRGESEEIEKEKEVEPAVEVIQDGDDPSPPPPPPATATVTVALAAAEMGPEFYSNPLAALDSQQADDEIEKETETETEREMPSGEEDKKAEPEVAKGGDDLSVAGPSTKESESSKEKEACDNMESSVPGVEGGDESAAATKEGRGKEEEKRKKALEASLRTKLLEKSQKIVRLKEQLDEQKSSHEVQSLKIKELEQEKTKLSREKNKLSKEIQRRSNSMAKLRKKETEVQEILEEGEKLSKRQHELEETIKKLRAKVKELEGEQKKAADKGLADVDEVHKQMLSLQKENKNLKANSETIEDQLLSYQKRVQELQELLSETESKAVENVERLRMDLQESSMRLHETEMQYADIAVNVPEATKPLVEQIEQLQQELASKEQTWSSVESNLSLKVRDLESKIRQYQKQQTGQQQLLKDGAEKLNGLATERDELQERLLCLEQVSHTSSQREEEELRQPETPRRLNQEKVEHLQAQLLEEKWKRESLEIELDRQREQFEKRVREEVEKTKQMMPSLQQQGQNQNAAVAQKKENSIESNGMMMLPEDPIPTPQKFIQASSTTNIAELEMVCNKLAEDLVVKSRLLSASQKRLKDLEHDYLNEDYLSLKAKHTMALELVGEKEEEIEHLNTDLVDLKRLYQEHITDVLERLNAVAGGGDVDDKEDQQESAEVPIE